MRVEWDGEGAAVLGLLEAKGKWIRLGTRRLQHHEHAYTTLTSSPCHLYPADYPTPLTSASVSSRVSPAAENLVDDCDERAR